MLSLSLRAVWSSAPRRLPPFHLHLHFALMVISQAPTTSAYALSLSPRRLVVCAAAPPSEVRAACSLLAEGLFAGGVQPGLQELQEASAAHRAKHGLLSGEYVHGTEPFHTRSVRVLGAAMEGDARAMHSLGSLSPLLALFHCHLAYLHALLPTATLGRQN